MADTRDAGCNTGPPALDAKFVEVINKLKDAKKLLEFIDMPTVLQVYGQESAQIIHDEIVWHLDCERVNDQNEDLRTRYGGTHRHGCSWIERKSASKDIKRLASLPGGKPLAVNAWLNIFASFCDDERENHCDFDYDEHPTWFENECLELCRELVKAAPSEANWRELNDACVLTRKKVYEEEWEREPGRPWFFWSMVCLLEDHSIRTSRLLVRKIFTGGNLHLPEELVEIVHDYYVANRASKMESVKYEFEHFQTRWPDRWIGLLDQGPWCECEECQDAYMEEMAFAKAESREEEAFRALGSDHTASEDAVSENNMGEEAGGEELAGALKDNDDRPGDVV